MKRYLLWDANRARPLKVRFTNEVEAYTVAIKLETRVPDAHVLVMVA